MKIYKYGITLSLLKMEDVAYVSQMLNPSEEDSLDALKDNTAEKVGAWIESNYNFESFYFIIEHKGVKIGLIAEKELDWQKRTSEFELVLWDETLTKQNIPLLAVRCLLETGFYYLYWNSFKTTVNQADSKRIETLNILGFRLSGDSKPGGDQEYSLTRNQFETEAQQTPEKSGAYTDKKPDEGYLLLEAADYETGIAQKIEQQITDSGVYLRRRGVAGGRKYLRKE